MFWSLFMATDAQVVLIHYESAQVLRYSWSFNQLAPVFCWILAPINTFSDSWLPWRVRPLIHKDSYCYSHYQDRLLRQQKGCTILVIFPKFPGFLKCCLEVSRFPAYFHLFQGIIQLERMEFCNQQLAFNNVSYNLYLIPETLI